MVEITCLFNLSLKMLKDFWVVVELVLLENFECDFVAILVPCFLDLATEALPKGFANDVVVDCCFTNDVVVDCFFYHLLMK